jgi:hypothetical protein
MAATAAVAVLVYYFTSLARPGFTSGFSHDDLMNLYWAFRDGWELTLQRNLLFFTSGYRPFGQLFYLSFFHLFGLEPLPYRIFCFGLLYANIGLTYLVVRRLTGRPLTGLIAALIHCFHAQAFPLYLGSGNCYDVFAFFFYFAILAYYIGLRNEEYQPTRMELLVIAIGFILALNSKEIAVTLPLAFLLFEVVLKQFRSWSAVVVTGSIALLFAVSKLALVEPLTTHPNYHQTFTIGAYLTTSAFYLNEVFYRLNSFTPITAAIFFASLCALALLLRDRILIFFALFATLAPLPIAFITPRGLAAYYIPYVALAAYAATLIARAQKLTRLPSIVIFTLAAVGMLKLHQHRMETPLAVHSREARAILRTARFFDAHPEWFPTGKKILIATDAFYDEAWASVFLAHLSSRDMSIEVVRLPYLKSRLQPPLDLDSFAKIIVFEGRRYRARTPEQFGASFRQPASAPNLGTGKPALK